MPGIITELYYLPKVKLHAALRQYGAEGVIERLRHEWTPERPTANYCWVVSEVAYRFLMPKGTTAWVITYRNGEKHWFLKDPDGNVVDLTADQFPRGWLPNYLAAKRYNFWPRLSKRGRHLAELLGLIKEENNEGN